MSKLLLLLCLLSLDVRAVSFPKDFFFGVANAPGQVEDNLPDIWTEWGDQDKIRAYKNQTAPHKRLEFWTHPEVELDLAQKAGVKVFRMGVDWGRVMPAAQEFDAKVIERYRVILKMVQERKMQVMLSLMHHSIPKWAQNLGGWKQDEMITHFEQFSQRMLKEFAPQVDYWISFNEPTVFVALAYSVGIWPPGEKSGATSMLAIGPFAGDAIKAMDRMAEAHNLFYRQAHQHSSSIKVGIAHNMAFYTSKNWIDRLSAWYIGHVMNWRFPSKIEGHMDFFGINYYGAEWVKGSSIDIDPEEEYSEAGRAIYPQGLYHLLKDVYAEYQLPIIITENGIADATDNLRPAYLVEHLMSVHQAMQEGVKVNGFLYWSLTDNLEWADGYCPKFGLVNVLRDQKMAREPRPSFQLFSRIARSHTFSEELRQWAWNKVVMKQGQERPFCRSMDGISALDVPAKRKVVKKDWRFKL